MSAERPTTADASPSTHPDGDAGTVGPAFGDAMALIQLSGLIQETVARVAGRQRLTPVQGRLLWVLTEQPRGMAELARIFAVGKANLTGLIDRVEHRGLVERSLVPGDRRAVQVVLTDDGRRAALAFHRDVTSELAGLLEPLTPKAQDDFRQAVTTISHSAGHSTAWGPCQAC
ncbi:MarR family winged helix-turn-helix transcriptional regulator [Plantactinospora endophytica]|nr:MarR family winged helix-turn-helix transcriptional regulator [Plantactinospora endophytica]